MKLAARTPAGISGTHKNLRSPCNLPNLFSCQISSSSTYVDLPRVSRYESYSLPSRANPRAPPTQCSTPAYADLQHQIGLSDPRALAPNPWVLVELTGIEPVASWLQTRRSPSRATAPTRSFVFGHRSLAKPADDEGLGPTADSGGPG